MLKLEKKQLNDHLIQADFDQFKAYKKDVNTFTHDLFGKIDVITSSTILCCTHKHIASP